jgi:hypothetical protein
MASVVGALAMVNAATEMPQASTGNSSGGSGFAGAPADISGGLPAGKIILAENGLDLAESLAQRVASPDRPHAHLRRVASARRPSADRASGRPPASRAAAMTGPTATGDRRGSRQAARQVGQAAPYTCQVPRGIGSSQEPGQPARCGALRARSPSTTAPPAIVGSPLQVLKLINNFFTIPDRSWPGPLSRRREGEHAEDVSAHKPGAF